MIKVNAFNLQLEKTNHSSSLYLPSVSLKRKHWPVKICNSIGAQISCGQYILFFLKKNFFFYRRKRDFKFDRTYNRSLTVFQMKRDSVFKTTPTSNVQYFVLQFFTRHVYTPDIGTGYRGRFPDRQVKLSKGKGFSYTVIVHQNKEKNY